MLFTSVLILTVTPRCQLWGDQPSFWLVPRSEVNGGSFKEESLLSYREWALGKPYWPVYTNRRELNDELKRDLHERRKDYNVTFCHWILYLRGVFTYRQTRAHFSKKPCLSTKLWRAGRAHALATKHTHVPGFDTLTHISQRRPAMPLGPPGSVSINSSAYCSAP